MRTDFAGSGMPDVFTADGVLQRYGYQGEPIKPAPCFAIDGVAFVEHLVVEGEVWFYLTPRVQDCWVVRDWT